MRADAALLDLLRLLKTRHYRFIAVTPTTHQRVLRRPCERPDLRDIFGWSRPFAEADLDPQLLDCLTGSSMIERDGDKLRSLVRVASVGEDLLLHSAFPTVQNDAVFFGPDTYRFIRFLRECIPTLQPAPSWVIDMGTGSGAGAIAAAHLLPAARVTGVDVNTSALRFAAINANAAGVSVDWSQASEVPSGADLMIANPPYIMDAEGRAYRNGGSLLGGQVALDWSGQALHALAPGGTMFLYTGAAVAAGEAPLIERLQHLSAQVEEIDPDVFGEELDQPAYAAVERIAIICATLRKG